MCSSILGYFYKPCSHVKTAVATFSTTVVNIWATFTPTSGHTDREPLLSRQVKTILAINFPINVVVIVTICIMCLCLSM